MNEICFTLNFKNYFVFQLHPDNVWNEKFSKEETMKAHDNFVKVVEAYEILGKPKKREIYDKTLAREAAEAIRYDFKTKITKYF